MIFLGLGSNLGDREKTLRLAIEFLEEAKICVLKQSSLYETEPVLRGDAQDTGDHLPKPSQPWFLNMVAQVETDFSPEELLKVAMSIEVALGRVREKDMHEKRFDPRTIDIDILFYGSRVIALPGLQIPHPRAHERRFVLVPITEIAPEFVHPLLQKSMAELLKMCKDKSRINKP